MTQPTTGKGRHPRALYVLFLTEMWERFAYYLLAGILFLYLTDNKTGGKGLLESNAADITGTFLALIWLPLFIGGMIADRYFGYNVAVRHELQDLSDQAQTLPDFEGADPNAGVHVAFGKHRDVED